MFPAEAQFFGDARDAERLAGKAGAEDVMRRNVRHRHGMDVAEIGGVGLLRVFVPVGGKHALAPGTLKRDAESPMPQNRSMKRSGAAGFGVPPSGGWAAGRLKPELRTRYGVASSRIVAAEVTRL